jgi:hypothetical protein
MSLPTDAEHWYLDDSAANNTVAAFIGTAGTMLTSAGAALNTSLVSVAATKAALVNGFSFTKYNSNDPNYISVPYNAAYNVSDNLSVSVWFQLDTGFGNGVIVGRWTSDLCWEFQVRSDNYANGFFFAIRAPGGTIYYPGLASNYSWSSGANQTGTLYHIVGTFAAGSVNIYINGALNKQTTIATSTIKTGTTDPIRMGNVGDGNNMKGWIYEARVYTGTVLSLANVQYLYNSGNGTQAELPSAYQPRLGASLGTPFMYLKKKLISIPKKQIIRPSEQITVMDRRICLGRS